MALSEGPDIITRAAQRGAGGGGRPPLLFVHGAFVGPWCWDRHFLPFFADAGWTAHALTLRGHGAAAGDRISPGPGLREYGEDLRAALDQVGHDAILIGHSMGAAVIGKWLEEHKPPAVALLAPPPPSGLSGPSFRLSLTQPYLFHALSVAQGFGPAAADAGALARLFFADRAAAEDGDLARMQPESPRAILDMTWLDLPITARWPELPAFVAVGAEDVTITPGEAAPTAKALGVDLQVLPGLGHALMLDGLWRDAAQALKAWLARL